MMKKKNTDQSCIEDEQGKIVPIDFHNIDDWEEHKIGPFSAPLVTTEFRNHMKSALKNAASFRKEMVSSNPAIQCPIGVLASQSVPTVTKIVKVTAGSLKATGSIKGYHLDLAPKPMGDGRLLMRDAIPPGLTVCKTWETKEAHSQLLNDSKVPEMLSFLIYTAEEKKAPAKSS